MCGPYYEVVWLQLLQLVLGSSAGTQASEKILIAIAALAATFALGPLLWGARDTATRRVPALLRELWLPVTVAVVVLLYPQPG